MNKANFPATKGMPLYKEDLGFLQDANFEAFKGIASAFIQGGIDTFILSGCVVNVTEAGIQCTEGYMVYKGEVMKVDAVVNGFILGELVAAPVVTFPGSLNPVTLSDLTTANIYSVRKATFTDDGLALADNVPYTQIRRIEDIIRSVVNGDDTWHTVGGTGEPAFQSGWANEAGGLFNNAQFRKTQQGQVFLRGRIRNTGYDSTKKLVFTLPTGYIPAKSSERYAGTDNEELVVKIYGNSESAPNRGKVELIWNNTGPLSASLDNIFFWLT